MNRDIDRDVLMPIVEDIVDLLIKDSTAVPYSRHFPLHALPVPIADIHKIVRFSKNYINYDHKDILRALALIALMVPEGFVVDWTRDVIEWVDIAALKRTFRPTAVVAAAENVPPEKTGQAAPGRDGGRKKKKPPGRGDTFHDQRNLVNELLRFLDRPAALQAQGPAGALVDCDEKLYIPYCDSATKFSCPDYTEDGLGCPKIHFVPVIKKWTDPKLGDCSYLDTCHRMGTCKFLHYTAELPKKARAPRSMVTRRKAEKEPPKAKILDAQWINCDIRKLDFGILGKFAVIMADPAWSIHTNTRAQQQACNDAALLDLPIWKLQDEGIMMLWVTGRAMEMGRECLTAWGYRRADEIVWMKVNQLQKTVCTGRTGHWLNHSKEHLLIGIKGNPTWLNRGLDTDIIVSVPRETGRKPDEIYGIIDRLVGPDSRKLELFGRQHNTRSGWLTIGDELEGTRLLEPELSRNHGCWKMLTQNANFGNNDYNAFRDNNEREFYENYMNNSKSYF
ncbi:MT-A70-domain-containing protein [Dipodascopsis tothii]|uniref:MT-A70-domain-containing protein n=1 Tax=Dipodascopsis tothii TaxID=44089 RepID=UPI0034CDF6EE